jgi:hypothetical protein
VTLEFSLITPNVNKARLWSAEGQRMPGTELSAALSLRSMVKH